MQQVTSSKVDSFTRAFFWFGYIVFLGASIPHIATYFHHFDAPATGLQEWMNWIIAILLAIVIDVSDVLVSIAVIKAQAAGAKTRDTFGYWAFIVLIMALSWLFNWQYNIVFGTNEFAAADKVSLLGFVTVGQINPIVGSAFQLLLLVYTGMAHKFSHKPVEKSAKELEQEANELEAKQQHLARIEAVKKSQSQRGINNFFDKVNAVKDNTFKTVGVGQSGVDDLDKTVAFLTDNPQATDEQLAQHLGKKRPASARFWRLKALEIMQLQAQKAEVAAEPIAPQSGTEGGTLVEVDVEETTELETEENRMEDGTNGGSADGRITDPEMEAVNVVQFRPNGTTTAAKVPLRRKSSRNKLMTVAEVAAELGCSERYVRDLRSDGTLETDENDKKLITSASVKAYDASRQKKQVVVRKS